MSREVSYHGLLDDATCLTALIMHNFYANGFCMSELGGVWLQALRTADSADLDELRDSRSTHAKTIKELSDYKVEYAKTEQEIERLHCALGVAYHSRFAPADLMPSQEEVLEPWRWGYQVN